MKAISSLLLFFALVSCSSGESLDTNLSVIATSYSKEKQYPSDKAEKYDECYKSEVKKSMSSNNISEEIMVKVSADLRKNMTNKDAPETDKERFWNATRKSPEGVLMGEMISCAMQLN